MFDIGDTYSWKFDDPLLEGVSYVLSLTCNDVVDRRRGDCLWKLKLHVNQENVRITRMDLIESCDEGRANISKRINGRLPRSLICDTDNNVDKDEYEYFAASIYSYLVFSIYREHSAGKDEVQL